MPRMTLFNGRDACYGDFFYANDSLAIVECDWSYVHQLKRVKDVKGLKKLMRASKKYKKHFEIKLKDENHAIRHYEKRIQK